MKQFTTDYDYANAKMAGKKKIADTLTQMQMLKMEVGQKMCIASMFGVKYFKCIAPPKKKLKIWIDEADEIRN